MIFHKISYTKNLFVSLLFYEMFLYFQTNGAAILFSYNTSTTLPLEKSTIFTSFQNQPLQPPASTTVNTQIPPNISTFLRATFSLPRRRKNPLPVDHRLLFSSSFSSSCHQTPTYPYALWRATPGHRANPSAGQNVSLMWNNRTLAYPIHCSGHEFIQLTPFPPPHRKRENERESVSVWRWSRLLLQFSTSSVRKKAHGIDFAACWFSRGLRADYNFTSGNLYW